jgi:mannose-6-phosphate isomerase-like protein (cupin superfamily)
MAAILPRIARREEHAKMARLVDFRLPGELMRTILIPSIVLLAVFTGPLQAQRREGAARGGPVTLAILVSDPSGAPVPDVKVTVSGAASRTTRTESGRAVFEGLPVGDYLFRFEKEGYISVERQVTGRGAKPIDVNVTLTPMAPPLKPVGPLPPPAVDATFVVLDLPAFIEKNYVGRAAGKTTPIGCAAGGAGTLLQVNEPVAEHTHADADEFVYVIAGQGTVRLGDRQETLGPGGFLMIPRRMAHSLTAGPKKPLVLLSVHAGEKC